MSGAIQHFLECGRPKVSKTEWGGVNANGLCVGRKWAKRWGDLPPVPGIAREHLLAVVQQETAAEDSFDFQCCCGFWHRTQRMKVRPCKKASSLGTSSHSTRRCYASCHGRQAHSSPTHLRCPRTTVISTAGYAKQCNSGIQLCNCTYLPKGKACLGV